MPREFVNKLLLLATKDMDMSTERGFWLVLESISLYRFLVALLLILSFVVAILEASSVALSASAVVVITSAETECAASMPEILSSHSEALCGGG